MRLSTLPRRLSSLLAVACAAALAGCVFGVVVATFGLTLNDGFRPPENADATHLAITASKHGQRPHLACVMPQALAEAEISPDEVEAGHSRADSWPREGASGPSERGPGSRQTTGGQAPAVLLANAADLCRLCRLLI